MDMAALTFGRPLLPEARHYADPAPPGCSAAATADGEPPAATALARFLASCRDAPAVQAGVLRSIAAANGQAAFLRRRGLGAGPGVTAAEAQALLAALPFSDYESDYRTIVEGAVEVGGRGCGLFAR